MTAPVAVKSLTFIEIDVDYCSLTYGVEPCTATLAGENPTGTRKCMNTRKTCQDRAHFTNAPETLRFAIDSGFVPRAFDAITSIESIDYSPGIISLGKNLGQRASLTVTFKDHPWSDTGPGFDKYLGDRSYNPYKQGTFFGKFRARQPFLQGRALRWIDGVLGQQLAEMDTRHFIIESFDGPTPDGRYRLVAKDILKLADGDRAQAPALSPGRLLANLTSGGTTATLTPSGVGNSKYQAAGYLNLSGSEVVSFTRIGDALTFTGRGLFGTTAVAHGSGDRAQECLYFDGQDPADIIRDLLVDHAGLSEDWIPIDDWRAETASYYRRVLTALIAEPTSVNQLVSEVIEQAALAVWWEPLAPPKVRLQVLRPIITSAERYDVSNTIETSFTARDQADKRMSRVWVYFGQRNPLAGMEDPSNYRATAERIHTDLEADYGGEDNKKVYPIYSRWIAPGALTTAQRLCDILLAQYKTPPRRFTLSLHRRGAETPTLGEGVRLSAQIGQDDTGAPEDIPAQITRVKPTPARFEIEAEEANFASVDEDDLNNRTITITSNDYNLNIRSLHDDIYPEPVGSETVTFIVDSGVTIGSISTAVAALRTGSWPAGVTLNVVNRGRVQGKGGPGGRGKTKGGASASSGAQGGIALLVESEINLDNSLGTIDGGAGGGGGGGVLNLDNHKGGGGGGGAGSDGGEGGGSDYQAGAPGSADSGGNGGQSYASNWWFEPPFPTPGGGRGGDPGQAGSAGGVMGGNPGESAPGAGGPAGAAIDGVSLVTDTGAAGTRRGPQIN